MPSLLTGFKFNKIITITVPVPETPIAVELRKEQLISIKGTDEGV